MAGGASHNHDEVPAPGRSRIFHNVLHQLAPQLSGRFETERWYFARQRQIIVDGFGHMTDANAALRLLCYLTRGEHRIVATNAR